MTRHSVFLLIAIGMVIIGAACVAVWFVADQGPLADGREIQPTPHQYDTTGGQEMRPRWNSQEGASHDSPNN